MKNGSYSEAQVHRRVSSMDNNVVREIGLTVRMKRLKSVTDNFLSCRHQSSLSHLQYARYRRIGLVDGPCHCVIELAR